MIDEVNTPFVLRIKNDRGVERKYYGGPAYNNNNNNNNNKFSGYLLTCGLNSTRVYCQANTTTTTTTTTNNNNNNNNNNKTIPSNRPDITFTNKKTKNIVLIDIAIPNTHNLAKTITEKQNKYQELANEIRDMWKKDAVQVVPIVISATRIIPKSLLQSLKRLNLHRNTYIYRCKKW
jgi:hypothetical protein